MKTSKILISALLVIAVLFSMVLSTSAYTTTNGAFKTTGTAGKTYVYDFKDADGNPADASNFRTSANAGLVISNDADGLRFKSTGFGGYGTDSMTNFLLETKLYDPDVAIGAADVMKVEAGHCYEITAVWQSTFAGPALGLIRDKKASDGFAGHSGTIYQVDGTRALSAKSPAGYTDNVTTFRIDGDGSTHGFANAGSSLGFNSHDGATILLKKVTVTVYSKSAWDCFTDSSSVKLTFDNGLKDLYMPNGDALNLGDVEIAADPTNSGRGNTMKFVSNGSESTFTFGLAAKPGYGMVKGVEPNAFVTADGFKTTGGNKYRVTFDAYLADADDGETIPGGFYMYRAGAAGISYVGNKTAQNAPAVGAARTDLNSNEGNGQWHRFEYIFTSTSDTDREYLAIGLSTPKDSNGNAYAFTLYLDNISVTDITNVPASYAEEVRYSIRGESGSGENYVSAGLRFRGEIPTATASAASEVGFIVAPTALVKAYSGTAEWYDMTAGAPALDKAISANATNKIYGINGDNNQYQCIITSLTKEGEAKSLKNAYMDVVMYVKDVGGNYSYYFVGRSCYGEVANAYLNNNIEF